MTLEQAQKGEKLIVMKIMDSDMRVKAIRFGIMEGAEITCMEKLPSGPVVIQKGKQELAIGLGLARRIVVEPALSILSTGGSLSYGTNRSY
ncbi:MAG: ferrous iron transport protein A [Bacillota bacterium]|nr:ferrous iron transport protein A [Bacillota bacterium]